MNIGEATLVNRLLDALLGIESPFIEHPADLQLAAETLAVGTRKTLGAGIGPDQVAERWGKAGLSACIGLNRETVARMLRGGFTARNAEVADLAAARRSRRSTP